MFKACLAASLPLVLLVTAGCNTAPDNDEDYEEYGVLRIPADIPAAPEGMIAVAGDCFYLYVPQDWQTESWKFLESDLSGGISCELLDGGLNEESSDPAEVVGSLNVERSLLENHTLEEVSSVMVDTWKHAPGASVGHSEISPVAIPGQTSAFLQVMEAQFENQPRNPQMPADAMRFLFIDLYASDNPQTYWHVSYQLSCASEHADVRHDSKLGKALVDSVKSLVIVPEAVESPATPR